ncbi:MAG: DUF1588 domain-containing protein, partial [Verrucomicrobiales bacterium]
LINTEPEFNPDKPGLRTWGDAVSINHGGELKLYFGIDRITRVQGGTVAYATAVKSVPEVLSSSRKSGFESYADFDSVKSAEATQILGQADDLLRYMAYGPRSIAKPEQITDDPRTYKMEGDLRGLPTSIVYNTKVIRPLTPVLDLIENPFLSDDLIRAAVEDLFESLTFRPPSSEESDAYVQIVKDSVSKLGKEDGVFMGLSAIFLHRDALFRPELVQSGTADEHGRVMLQDWELGLAVNHALRYLKPDDELRHAIEDGRMRSRADVEREVTRMLENDRIRKPRVLRFFREYFDHDIAGYICKDTKALIDAGAPPGNLRYYRGMFEATASTDRVIELILEEDRDVLKQLLTTRKVAASKDEKIYFGRRRTQEEVEMAEKERRKEVEEAVREIEGEIERVEAELAELNSSPSAETDKVVRLALEEKEKELEQLVKDRRNARRPPTISSNVETFNFEGPEIYARAGYKSFSNGSMREERTLSTVPEGERLGILTHPSWLVSHTDAMDNHAIHRGIWVRERLLGGGIPAVPITVDAQLPDEPHHTLRRRMRVTREEYCWSCHEKMDPLGLPFEMYNHTGMYRTLELGEPVDTSGAIIDSGDPELDGPVDDAIEMIERLAESERVEQVFVRHAFRFWMGRNETLHDAPVLQEAHRAYRESGGSMKALITSLLTSDAFLFRKREF